jgi:hypothetical protein
MTIPTSHKQQTCLHEVSSARPIRRKTQPRLRHCHSQKELQTTGYKKRPVNFCKTTEPTTPQASDNPPAKQLPIPVAKEYSHQGDIPGKTPSLPRTTFRCPCCGWVPTAGFKPFSPPTHSQITATPPGKRCCLVHQAPNSSASSDSRPHWGHDCRRASLLTLLPLC